jgi:hypothetical protein
VTIHYVGDDWSGTPLDDLAALARETRTPDIYVEVIIPTDGSEPRGENVSAESREALRDSAWLPRILMELGQGHLNVDALSPDDLLRAVYYEVQALKQRKDGSHTVTEQIVVVHSDANAHGHHIQYRIIDMDDGVHESSEWLELNGREGDVLREIQSHLTDYQLQGLDVRIEEYRRCNHVNLTSRVEREP